MLEIYANFVTKLFLLNSFCQILYNLKLKARHIHKTIQAELTGDKRIQLHENNKAMQEIII